MNKKEFIYTESPEIKKIAEQLKSRYINLIGYVDLNKIFFTFKSGNNTLFKYEILGTQSEWVKFTSSNIEDAKTYCIALDYDFYQSAQGPLLQWILLDLLYSCLPSMNGKLRKKDVREFSRILNTIEDLGLSINWRTNNQMPDLLNVETIIFNPEEETEDELLQ